MDKNFLGLPMHSDEESNCENDDCQECQNYGNCDNQK